MLILFATLPREVAGLDDASASERALLTSHSESYAKILFSYVLARRGKEQVGNDLLSREKILEDPKQIFVVMRRNDNRSLPRLHNVHKKEFCRGREATKRCLLSLRQSTTALKSRRLHISTIEKKKKLQDLQILALELFREKCPLLAEIISI